LVNVKRLTLCKNPVFKKLQLHCIYFNDWLIAVSVHDDFILVEALLHKSRIRD
jgi:hypothetical protein